MKKRLPIGLLILSAIVLATLIVIVYLMLETRSGIITAEGYAAIAAFYSVLVACMALYIAYRQVELTESIARINAKPHCLLIRVKSNMQSKPVGIYWRNNGQGTAIVVEWAFTIKGIPIPEKNHDGLLKALGHYRLTMAEGMLIPPNQSLGAGQTEAIAYVPLEFGLTEMHDGTSSTIANKAMERFTDEVNFILRFKSAYNDEETISSLGLHDPA